ncbi:hypothetical protein CB1_000568027 [Camelus ferus]|nr:hypothetical protein CB1_000568027 [Camelus ferus]
MDGLRCSSGKQHHCPKTAGTAELSRAQGIPQSWGSHPLPHAPQRKGTASQAPDTKRGSKPVIIVIIIETAAAPKLPQPPVPQVLCCRWSPPLFQGGGGWMTAVPRRAALRPRPDPPAACAQSPTPASPISLPHRTPARTEHPRTQELLSSPDHTRLSYSFIQSPSPTKSTWKSLCSSSSSHSDAPGKGLRPRQTGMFQTVPDTSSYVKGHWLDKLSGAQTLGGSLVEDQGSWPLWFGRMDVDDPGEGWRSRDASSRTHAGQRPVPAGCASTPLAHSRFPESGVRVHRSVRVCAFGCGGSQSPSEDCLELVCAWLGVGGLASFWVEDLVNGQELLMEELVNTKSQGTSAASQEACGVAVMQELDQVTKCYEDTMLSPPDVDEEAFSKRKGTQKLYGRRGVGERGYRHDCDAKPHVTCSGDAGGRGEHDLIGAYWAKRYE